MARPQVAGISNTLYKRRLVTNVVKKQSRIFDRGLSPNLVNGRGVNSHSPLVIISTLHRDSDFGGFASSFFVKICRIGRICKDGIYILYQVGLLLQCGVMMTNIRTICAVIFFKLNLMKMRGNCFVFSQYTKIYGSLKMLKFHALCIFSLWRCGATRVRASSFLRFPDDTQRRATVGRTPLEKWSARRMDLYLTTHNTHNRQTSMSPAGYKSAVSAGGRPLASAFSPCRLPSFLEIHVGDVCKVWACTLVWILSKNMIKCVV
jgi:hypothetical protein